MCLGPSSLILLFCISRIVVDRISDERTRAPTWSGVKTQLSWTKGSLKGLCFVANVYTKQIAQITIGPPSSFRHQVKLGSALALGAVE